MEKRAQRMEEVLEQSLDKVTAHPAFLHAVSVVLNANSYRKIWMRKTFEALWKDLELPARRDQEKLLHHIEELNIRIKKLELDLQTQRSSLDPSSKRTVESISKGRKKEPPLKKIAADVEFR